MRRLFAVLLVLPLAGCVIPTDPVRLAAQGPDSWADLTRATRPLREGDTTAIAVLETSLDRERLRHCIVQGMQARLPQGVSVVGLDADRATTLADLAPWDATELALDERAATLGPGWAVAVRDATAQSSESHFAPFGGSGGGSGIFGVAAGQSTHYGLRLSAVLLDLQGARRIGRAAVWYTAEGGGSVAAGIFGGAGGTVAFALPFILPVIRLPAGTSAMAICNAFGRAIGDALVQATTPPPQQESPPGTQPASPAPGS